MLVPGLTLTSGRISVTTGAGITPDFYNQGLGFMSDGSLAIDTDPPTGSNYRAGFYISPEGALYGAEQAASNPSHSIQGLLVEPDGRVIYEVDGTISNYVCGNPVNSDGVLVVT